MPGKTWRYHGGNNSIISRNMNARQHNGQKNKKTNNGWQNITQKSKDWATLEECTKNRDNSDAAGGYAVSASLVEHVVLKILLLVI